MSESSTAPKSQSSRQNCLNTIRSVVKIPTNGIIKIIEDYRLVPYAP